MAHQAKGILMTNQSSMAACAPQSGVSPDTRAMMIFEANKKQNLVGYLLWFFVGYFGGHNFYLGRTGVAIAQLILTLTIIGLVVTFFWHIVDAFLIPGWVRHQNNQLATQLSAGSVLILTP
jgi:TM2 domain-containing membrane protein YozV